MQLWGQALPPSVALHHLVLAALNSGLVGRVIHVYVSLGLVYLLLPCCVVWTRPCRYALDSWLMRL